MLFARTSSLVLARSLVHGGGQTGMPAPTPSAASDYDALVGACEINHFLAGVVVIDNRSYRNFEDNILAFAPRLVRAFTVTSALGFVFRIKAKVHQRVVAFAGLHDDVSALAAVATRGSAARNELLPAERHAAIAAVPRLYPNFGFVDEHEQFGSATPDS